MIRPAEEAREALEAEALDVEALEALQAVELGEMTHPPSTQKRSATVCRVNVCSLAFSMCERAHARTEERKREGEKERKKESEIGDARRNVAENCASICLVYE